MSEEGEAALDEIFEHLDEAAHMWVTRNVLECMLAGRDPVTFMITADKLCEYFATQFMNIVETSDIEDRSALIIIGAMLVRFGTVIEQSLVRTDDIEEQEET